jgi:hypothetical protein
MVHVIVCRTSGRVVVVTVREEMMHRERRLQESVETKKNTATARRAYIFKCGFYPLKSIH